MLTNSPKSEAEPISQPPPPPFRLATTPHSINLANCAQDLHDDSPRTTSDSNSERLPLEQGRPERVLDACHAPSGIEEFPALIEHPAWRSCPASATSMTCFEAAHMDGLRTAGRRVLP